MTLDPKDKEYLGEMIDENDYHFLEMNHPLIQSFLDDLQNVCSKHKAEIVGNFKLFLNSKESIETIYIVNAHRVEY